MNLAGVLGFSVCRWPGNRIARRLGRSALLPGLVSLTELTFGPYPLRQIPPTLSETRSAVALALRWIGRRYYPVSARLLLLFCLIAPYSSVHTQGPASPVNVARNI